MAREIGRDVVDAEAGLCLAKFHLGQISSFRDEAERLSRTSKPPHKTLAELWLAAGEIDQAKKHSLAAYVDAWADGEPYVYRYHLNKAGELLEQLGVEIPNLPPHDPTKAEKLPWEDTVAAAIEELRAKKEAEKMSKEGEKRG